jgi:hypothetical protein
MAKWADVGRNFKQQALSDLHRAGVLTEPYWKPTGMDPRAKWTEDFDRLYRVLVSPATGKIEVLCLGIDSVDLEVEGVYANSSLLPAWVQERLAVLFMMKVDPPQTKIEGVGMRVDDNTFWVLK